MSEYITSIREGDLYKRVVVEDKSFEIRYGYNAEYERANNGEPIPILPDLDKETHYTKSGKRIVTFVQSSCIHFKMRCDNNDNDCCGDCIYYADNKEMIAPCECEDMMKTTEEKGGTKHER